MTEEQVRRIIREELSKFIFSDRFFIYKNMQFADGVSIQTGLTNGLKVGTTASEKLGFLGKSPVSQQATVTAPSGGGTSSTDAIDISGRIAINEIKVILTAFGFSA